MSIAWGTEVPVDLKALDKPRRSLKQAAGQTSWTTELNRKCGTAVSNDLELNRIPGGQTTMTTETMWRCDQVRAGRLYNRMMFDTREEAEQFMNRMRQMEPDQTISIEAIDARQVWN
jgi:hypothetical protein